MKLENKKKYILSLIIAILVIISLGTYAWLSYRTNDTAMVLTVGDINNVRITMSPYQIDTKISPNLTYTGQPYTTVEVINNSSSPRNIKLFYTINAIDSELATTNLKYTIEKKAVGESSYTHITPDGNFSGASKGSIITIIDESAPVGTTYYKVYVWLYSASSAQNNVTGKRFNAELNANIIGASIPNYVYTANIYDENVQGNNSVWIGQTIANGITQYTSVSSAMTDFGHPMALKHKISNFSGYCMYEKENGVETGYYNCFTNSQSACEANAADWEYGEYTYECRLTTASNMVTESYVVFEVTASMASANPGMTAGIYELKGGDNGASYGTNVSTLTTAFGLSNCTDYTSYFLCNVSGLLAFADLSGSVTANDRNDAECNVNDDGDSSCEGSLK